MSDANEAGEAKSEPAKTEEPPTTPPSETPATAKHPDVLAMENALERGDFHDARAIATRLSTSEDEALREAGRTMLARFELDPRVLAVLAVTAALIVTLAAMYLGRRH